ncbi:MAG: hypothetical protein ACSW8I_08910 [bacterium]
MKKTILLAVAMLIAGATTAQNETATLEHDGNVTVYYGNTALDQAYDAAQDSDIITLSSGYFPMTGNPQYINKPITIRGNGFEEDTLAGVKPTVVDVNSSAYIHTWSHDIVLEGLKFKSSNTGSGEFVVRRNIVCNKCYFERMQITRTTFTNSIIKDCVIDSLSVWDSTIGDGLIVTNTVITKMTGAGHIAFMNSIVGVDSNAMLHSNATFGDCVLLRRSDDTFSYPQTNCYRCIGIGYYTNFFANLPDYRVLTNLDAVSLADSLATADTSHYNYNFGSIASEIPYVFDSYQGEKYYQPGKDYHGLSITGGDYMNSLVQGGMIYQGMYPYSPFVNRPRFVRCDVAPVTTQDGKLSVNIQVVNTQE